MKNQFSRTMSKSKRMKFNQSMNNAAQVHVAFVQIFPPFFNVILSAFVKVSMINVCLILVIHVPIMSRNIFSCC